MILACEGNFTEACKEQQFVVAVVIDGPL